VKAPQWRPVCVVITEFFFVSFLFENGRTDLCYALVFKLIKNETTAEEVGSVK
jgi:hypothetical protein